MPARTPEEVDRLFQQFMRKGDIDAVLELYEPGIAFRNRRGEVKRGLESLREELAPFVAMKADFEFDLKNVVNAGDIVLIHNQWKVRAPREMSGYAIEVVRRQPEGTWRFAIGDPFTIGEK